MNVQTERIRLSHGLIHRFENRHLLFGYSESAWESGQLAEELNLPPPLQLKQIHSKAILSPAKIGPESEGDGILLLEPGLCAIIRTADCVPLFFWSGDFTAGGILHVGWRGFQQGIVDELIKKISSRHQPPGLYFHLGPAIEGGCYQVGSDLIDSFEDHPLRRQIFQLRPDGTHQLDLKSGIRLALKHAGVAEERISNSRFCTYCHPYGFPSYRRDRATGRRILNFIFLKP